MGLDGNLALQGGLTLTSGSLSFSERFGSGTGPTGTLVLADGTGAGQANTAYHKDFSIAAGADLDIDLKGGGGELDVHNVDLAFTAVKMVFIEITTPASGTSIRFGPQAVANAAQLWFPGVAAADWEEVLDKAFRCDARAGWAIGATTKVLRLHNPGAAAVAGKLRVWGTK